MAELIDWSKGTVDPETQSVINDIVNPNAFAPVHDPQYQSGLPAADGMFMRSLAAEFRLNHTLATALDEAYFTGTAGDIPDTFDPNFNQYSWMKEHVDPRVWDEQTGVLRDEIYNQNLLRDAITPHQTAAKIATLLREKQLISDAGQNFWGSTLGGLAGVMTDPVSAAAGLATGGLGTWWRSGRLLTRIGKEVVHTVSIIAPQEAMLQAQQDLRSWQEGVMNVGVNSFLFGGALGFGRAYLADHPLNIRNRLNPLRAENLRNQRVTDHIPGDDPVTISPASAGAAAAERAVPADAVPGVDELSADVVPSRLGGRSVLGTHTATPAARALQWSAPEARETILGLIDTNGVLADTDRFGVGRPASAQDIKDDLIERTLMNRLTAHEQAINDLGKELGDVKAPRLNEQDFLDTTQRILTGTLEPRDRDALTDKYGTAGATRILAKAEEMAAFNHEVNAQQAEQMKAVGAIRDDAKVDRLKEELDDLRAQRKAALAGHDAETGRLDQNAQAAIEQQQKGNADARAVDTLRRDRREQAVGRKAERRGLAAEFDEKAIMAALDHERGLAADLGKDYGHAQLWEPKVIAEHQERFKDALHLALVDRPDEHWLLDRFNMSAREFDQLRESGMDPARHLEILREWAVDEHDVRLQRLQNAVEDARQREHLAKLDYNDMLRSLGLLSWSEKQAELREYGRFRDALHAKIAAEREVRTNLLAEERAITEGATAARQQTLDRQLTIGTPSETPAAARQAERARQIASRLRQSDARLSDLLGKQRAADRAYQDARDARAARKSAKQAFQEATRDVLAHRELAGRNVDQVTRAARAAGRRTPLNEVIDEITANLMEHGRIPAGALEGVFGEPGRFKERRIVLTPQMRRQMADAGFLRTDLLHIFESQDKNIAGHIAIRQALDMGPTRRFESWKDVIAHVNAGYDRLKTGDRAKDAALDNERARALKDVEGMKDRLLNRADPGIDKDGWVMWGSRRMRDLNFIRYAAGMLMSSLSDIGAIALHHRVIPMLARHSGEMAEIFKTLRPETEFQRLLSHGEIAIHGSMLSRRLNEDELIRRNGIGTPGSLKHTITSAIERRTQALSEFMAHASVLPQWDRGIKIFAGLETREDIRKAIAGYARLSEVERTRLASLGIGEREAKQLKTYFDKYGEVDAKGRFDPHLEQWYGTTEGQQLARTFRIAVNRDMNRTRFWPGEGNRPLFMDKAVGKLFGQFQSFAYAFLTSYMHPLMQRAVHMQDLRAAVSLATLLAWGAINMTLKDAIRGVSPADRWNPKNPQQAAELALTLLDRSMVLGYLSPYVDAGVKLSGLTGSSKFQRNDALSSLLGINHSLLGDVSRLGASVTSGERGQEVLKKLLVLAPFSNWWRLGHSLYFHDYAPAYSSR